MDDDGGGNLNSYLEYTAPSTGTYFVEARGFSEEATGGYALRAVAGDIPADASTDVTLSADGDYRMGNLSPAGDRDWYRVDLAEGQGMRVGLNSGEGADALGDPYIVIYGPDGAETARDDDGGEALNSWLEYQAATAGPHYIEVRGFVDDASGRYILSLTPGEVGNQPEGGEYLVPNGEGRTAQIGSIGDVDWFAVEMIEGRPYRFNLMGGDGSDGSLVDPYLRLYDSSGTEIRADDDGGWGLNSYLTFVSVTGGTYFAAVSSFGDAGTGRYWLQVTDTDVPGHAYTDENLDAAGDDRVSRIDMPGDLDNFRVELEEGCASRRKPPAHTSFRRVALAARLAGIKYRSCVSRQNAGGRAWGGGAGKGAAAFSCALLQVACALAALALQHPARILGLQLRHFVELGHVVA
jgi:hypothetical protein